MKTAKAYSDALLFFKKNPRTLLWFVVNDLCFGAAVWLWYLLFTPSFDLVLLLSEPQSLLWKTKALGVAGVYGIGIILLFGLFATLSVHLICGQQSRGITLRRVRSMWFVQTTFAAALSALVMLLYNPFAALLPGLGDKILLGLLSFIASFLGIAAFVVGGTLIVTRDIKTLQLPFLIFRVLGQRWKEGIVLFFVFLGLIAVTEIAIVLALNPLGNTAADIIHIIIASGMIIVIRAYAKRVVAEWLSQRQIKTPTAPRSGVFKTNKNPNRPKGRGIFNVLNTL